jgi:hypothetical protein
MRRVLRNIVNAVVLLWATAAPLRAGIFDQLWPEADVYIKANANMRFYFYASGTRTEEAGRTDSQVGGAVDFFFAPLLEDREYRRPDQAANRMLFLRVGYFYDTTPKDVKNAYHANTPFIELTPRYYLPWKILATEQNRADFRFQNGVFFPRYRNRLRMERTFEMGKRAITPYADSEAFYDVRYNCFYRMRYEGGADFEFAKWFVLETYYLRQQDSRPKFKRLNIVGLTAQFHFR